MLCSTLNTYLAGKVATIKAQIDALDTAVLALSSGAIKSYTLDTGQSRQTVTKASIDKIHKTIDSLLNRLATLEARLNGCGTSTVRPCY